MPAFRYSGRSSRGDAVSGVLEADSPESLANHLFERGITPIDIQVAGVSKDVLADLWRRLGGGRPKITDLILFSRQMFSITKAGISRMTEVLAVEWSRFHINVNGIAPGAFRSEMMDGMIERVGDISQHFPRKRMGQPEQLDGTLLYLVSPSSECVTGTVVVVDDGQGGR